MKVKVTYTETWRRVVEADIDEERARDYLGLTPADSIDGGDLARYLMWDLEEWDHERWPKSGEPSSAVDEFDHIDVEEVEAQA